MDSVTKWIRDADFSAYGDGFVLMRELYIEYIYYCKTNGMTDICSDRLFSKALQDYGFEIKYTKKGTSFRLSHRLNA